MNRPQAPLSAEQVSLLELFEKLTDAQKNRIAVIVADRAEGRISADEFREQLRAVPSRQGS